MNRRDIDQRIRRAHARTGPGAPPDPAVAAELLARITAEPAPPAPPKGAPRAACASGRRPGRMALAGLACGLTLAGTAAAGIAIIAPDGPAAPLGASTPVALLDRLADPGQVAPMPPADARRLGELAEINPQRVIALAGTGDAWAYAGLSAGNPERVCLAAFSAAHHAVGCGEAAHIATGRIVVSVPTRTGGRETPRVRFGLVPDDVVSVSAQLRGGGLISAPAAGNAFALALPDAGAASRVEFARADGTRVGLAEPG